MTLPPSLIFPTQNNRAQDQYTALLDDCIGTQKYQSTIRNPEDIFLVIGKTFQALDVNSYTTLRDKQSDEGPNTRSCLIQTDADLKTVQYVVSNIIGNNAGKTTTRPQKRKTRDTQSWKWQDPKIQEVIKASAVQRALYNVQLTWQSLQTGNLYYTYNAPPAPMKPTRPSLATRQAQPTQDQLASSLALILPKTLIEHSPNCSLCSVKSVENCRPPFQSFRIQLDNPTTEIQLRKALNNTYQKIGTESALWTTSFYPYQRRDYRITCHFPERDHPMICDQLPSFLQQNLEEVSPMISVCIPRTHAPDEPGFHMDISGNISQEELETRLERACQRTLHWHDNPWNNKVTLTKAHPNEMIIYSKYKSPQETQATDALTGEPPLASSRSKRTSPVPILDYESEDSSPIDALSETFTRKLFTLDSNSCLESQRSTFKLTGCVEHELVVFAPDLMENEILNALNESCANHQIQNEQVTIKETQANHYYIVCTLQPEEPTANGSRRSSRDEDTMPPLASASDAEMALVNLPVVGNFKVTMHDLIASFEDMLTLQNCEVQARRTVASQDSNGVTTQTITLDATNASQKVIKDAFEAACESRCVSSAEIKVDQQADEYTITLKYDSTAPIVQDSGLSHLDDPNYLQLLEVGNTIQDVLLEHQSEAELKIPPPSQGKYVIEVTNYSGDFENLIRSKTPESLFISPWDATFSKNKVTFTNKSASASSTNGAPGKQEQFVISQTDEVAARFDESSVRAPGGITSTQPQAGEERARDKLKTLTDGLLDQKIVYQSGTLSDNNAYLRFNKSTPVDPTTLVEIYCPEMKIIEGELPEKEGWFAQIKSSDTQHEITITKQVK